MDLFECLRVGARQVYFIKQKQRVAAYESSMDRLHGRTYTVPTEQQPRAHLIDCTGREHRYVGISRPVIMLDHPSTQHRTLEDGAVLPDDCSERRAHGP